MSRMSRLSRDMRDMQLSDNQFTCHTCHACHTCHVSHMGQIISPQISCHACHACHRDFVLEFFKKTTKNHVTGTRNTRMSHLAVLNPIMSHICFETVHLWASAEKSFLLTEVSLTKEEGVLAGSIGLARTKAFCSC